MSQLTEFYLGEGKDCEQRTLFEILAEDDDYLEVCHDYIQWLFPLAESSNFNPDAPIVTEEDIQAFKTDKLLPHNMRKSFNRFLNFLGLYYAPEVKKVFKLYSFNEDSVNLWKHANHNWLRITRVLASLKLFGLDVECEAFFERLKQLHEEDGFVSDNSFSYWEAAAHGKNTA
jgi:predicted AlkP superfamily pyrophosphatase or phosphodiesterase